MRLITLKFTAVALLFFPIVCNAQFVECSSEPPWAIESSVQSANNTTTVSHYTLNRDVGGNIWRRVESCVLVTDSRSSWWVDATTSDVIFSFGEFIDHSRLLLLRTGVAAIQTELLDLTTHQRTNLGGGRGTYIKQGQNAGLILLAGQKRHFEGALWTNVLVNLYGEVIEFIPSEFGNCIRIADILNDVESTAKLRQSVDDCVVVAR